MAVCSTAVPLTAAVVVASYTLLADDSPLTVSALAVMRAVLSEGCVRA